MAVIGTYNYTIHQNVPLNDPLQIEFVRGQDEKISAQFFHLNPGNIRGGYVGEIGGGRIRVVAITRSGENRGEETSNLCELQFHKQNDLIANLPRLNVLVESESALNWDISGLRIQVN